MKTYIQKFNDKIYLYYFDTNIRLWTIYECDKYGNQLWEEADHDSNKVNLSAYYPFLTFESNFEFEKEPKSDIPTKISINMEKLSHRTQEAVEFALNTEISQEALVEVIKLKELLESLEPSKRTHYDRLNEWSDVMYGFVHKKLKKFKFINGGAAMGKKQNPQAELWWHIYGIVGAGCYSRHLEHEPVANHHTSAYARNKAVIAELNDIINIVDIQIQE